jgi:hypothetical protein
LSYLRERVCAAAGSDVNVKTNKQKIATKPFFIFPLTPFSNPSFPFAVLLAMSVPMREYVNNADFLQFF